jgi:hypothetical protein
VVLVKKIVIIVLVFLVVISFSVTAQSTITTTPINNQVDVNGNAQYSLEIKNHEAVSQRYSIFSFQSGQGWNVDPYPLRDKVIELGPGKSYTTMIQIQPLEDFSPGIYHISIAVESDRGEKYSKALKVYLRPETPVEYVPALKVTADLDEKINPQESISIKLFIENRNPLDLQELKVRIQSDLFEFRKEAVIDLPPLEKKTVEFSITPNPFTQPKEYVLFFVFERDGQDIKVVEQKIEILPLLPGFELDAQKERIFLKDFYGLHITNKGNVLNSQEVNFPTTLWQSMFTRGDVQAVSIDGERFLTAQVSLGPNETATLHYVTNYRIPIYLLLVIIVLLTFYLSVQSPIEVIKSAQTTKGSESGSLSEIKVTLEVRNKTSRPLTHVKIIDIVPAIANIEKSLELGTLRPNSIKHTKNGTKVEWDLAEVDGQEHRLISYKVKTKLNVLGTFSLQRAQIHYKKGKGRSKKAYSNVFKVEL